MCNRIFVALRMSFTLCRVTAMLLVGFLPAVARGQRPDSEPTEETPEAAIEPTPLPGTGIPLEPQLPPSEAPLPRRTKLKLVPPGVVEPILPRVNFEALGRSGRLWTFQGVVKEFRFVGNHVFSTG